MTTELEKTKDIAFLAQITKKWARRFIDGHFEMSIIVPTRVKDQFLRKYGFDETREIVARIENEVAKEMLEEYVPHYDPRHLKPIKPRVTHKPKQPDKPSRQVQRHRR
jgi:hypothetical protein